MSSRTILGCNLRARDQHQIDLRDDADRHEVAEEIIGKIRDRGSNSTTRLVSTAMNSVWPSGVERVTAAAASAPFAPGWFSTITGCRINSERRSPRLRAIRSTAPPAGCGKIKRIGLERNSSSARAYARRRRMSEHAKTGACRKRNHSHDPTHHFAALEFVDGVTGPAAGPLPHLRRDSMSSELAIARSCRRHVGQTPGWAAAGLLGRSKPLA